MSELQWKRGRPRKFETVEDMAVAIDDYFEKGCWVTDGEGVSRPMPTVTGLAISIGLTRMGLLHYQGRDEFKQLIDDAKATIEEFMERKLYGKAVTGVIFNLKNNYAWVDKIEQHTTSDDSGLTDDELDAKIKSLLDEEVDNG